MYTLICAWHCAQMQFAAEQLFTTIQTTKSCAVAPTSQQLLV